MKWKSPVVPWSSCTPAQKKLLEISWKRGELSYKLTPSQQSTYRKIVKWTADAIARIFALDSSRRWGKSVLLTLLAFEFAIKRPGSRIVYCAPTFEMVRKILLPLISDMTSDCPPELRPTWAKSEKTFYFPNGSRIELYGLDLNPDAGRGTGVDYVLLDEAGFFDNLSYLLNSIIKPQMLGRRHARVICASTPSKTPGHYWSSELVPTCVSNDSHDLKTLLDADQYDEAEKQEFIAECPGGRNGTTCRREYFCEHIVDEESAILPEFRDVEADVVAEHPTPQWRDCYTILDPGFNDLAAALFCYWDFTAGILVVEDEFAKARENSGGVAKEIRRIEEKLWKGSMRRGPSYSLQPQPYLRFSDNDPRLLADLAADHGLVFAGVHKKRLELMVNDVRTALSEKRIRIHPRCKKLVAHCRNAIWKSRTTKNLDFARPGGEFGHYDLVACLVYAWLSVQKHRNPTPPVERIVRGDIKTGRFEGEPERSKWSREGSPLHSRGGALGRANR